MSYAEWTTQETLARLYDGISRISCSDYERRLRERLPLVWGQTAADREQKITTAIIESWSWR